jgi:hypothetical protein
MYTSIPTNGKQTRPSYDHVKGKTDVLVTLRPEWKKFVRKNGKVGVKVKNQFTD